MECLACGSDNQEDSKFCRGCGASLGQNTPEVIPSTPEEIDTNGQDQTEPIIIPSDAVVVRQSHWAYLLYAIPGLGFLGASMAFDFLTFGVFPLVVIFYIVGSRYLSFHRTAYIFTDSHIVIFHGAFFGRKRIDLPFSNLSNVLVQPGMFGKYLGYTDVGLQLVNQRVTLLQYVPVSSPILERLRAHIKPAGSHETEPDGESEE